MHTILKKQNLNIQWRRNSKYIFFVNYSEIVNYLIGKIPKNKKIWYQKHMAHHILDLNNIEWINNCHNAILLRHPKEVISSPPKNILNSVDQLGYPQRIRNYKVS